MPIGDYADFDACVRDNTDKRDPEAYCAEIKRSIEGATLTDAEAKALEQSECEEGYVHVGGECRRVEDVVESVDAPPSILSDPMHLTLKSLDTEPIERVEEDGTTVRYRNLKLLAPGIWGDAGSEAYAYYPPDGIKNLEAHYDAAKYDGPPLNIMHDLDMEDFEAHEPSIAGYIDPDSIDHDDDGAKFADIVLDTSTGAGQYADENLQSTLENKGRVGFGGPSVEIPAEGLEQSYDHDRGMHRVDGGRLTGAALVQDPASKSVSFAKEAARRPVAMSGVSSKDAKVLTQKDVGMSDGKTLEADPEQVREILDAAGIDVAELEDEEVMSMAESLHGDLMDELEGSDDEEGVEAEEDDYDEDEEEDEDGAEMQEGEDIDALREQLANFDARLEDVEDALSQAMTAEDVNAELEDAAGNKLADVESVKTLEDAKEDLETRIAELEDAGKDAKTLTDANTDEDSIDYSAADGGISYDPATGSMSK